MGSASGGATWQPEFFGRGAGGGASAPELLRETNAYRRDWLGVRTLDERGALAVLDCRCSRAQLRDDPASLRPFLNASLVPFLRAAASTRRGAGPGSAADGDRVRGVRVERV